MTGRRRASWPVSVAALGLMVAVHAAGLGAQRAPPADVAARITGTWQMNLDESPQFRPGRQGGTRPAAGIWAAGPAPRAALALQRGGGRGGGGGMGPGGAPPDPRAMAGQRAIATMQQVPATMTIEATAETVTFKDPRGVRTYQVDNRTHREDVGDGATMTTKSRWDRNTLRQEFIVGETKVSHAFQVDDDGRRIAFTLRIDNFSGGVGREAKAVYDKVE